MTERDPVTGLGDDEDATLVCMPVEESLVVGDRVVDCADCKVACWVSAKSEYLLILYGERMQILCVQCALVRTAESPDDVEWRAF
jgi:hypothetical protein